MMAFDKPTWSFILCVIVFSSLYLKMLKDSPKTSWLSIIAIVCQKSVQLTKNIRWNVRVLFGTLFLAFFILNVLYSNLMCTESLIPIESNTIDSINDLYKAQAKGKINLLMVKETSYYSLLKNSGIEIFKMISDLVHFVDTIEECFIKVFKEDKYAMISNRNYLLHKAETIEQGGFHLPPHSEMSTFFLDFTAFAYRPDFEYVEEYDFM